MNLKRRLTALFIVVFAIALLAAAPLYQNVQTVSVKQRTAFNEISVAEFTPMAGWSFQYLINPEVVVTDTVGSATITKEDNKIKLTTAAGTNNSATVHTKRSVRYLPGVGGLGRFTAIFDDCVAGNTQIIGLGNTNDGFFFGCNGADFGVMRRDNGSDSWITGESLDTDIDRDYTITNGNVYQIKYQWLGFGNVYFFMEDPETGLPEIVHTIKYANTATDTTVRNPQLAVFMQTANTTNNTAVSIESPSAIGGVEGKTDAPVHPLTLVHTARNSKTNVSTETALLTISNTTTINGITNAMQVHPRALSISSDGTKSVIIRGVIDTTLGGTPSFSAYNASSSPVYTDTAGTTLTGGTLAFSVELGKAESKVIDLRQYGIYLSGGQRLTISAESSLATEAAASVTWEDLF